MNTETVIENAFHLKEPVAEDALAQIFRAEIDLQAFDYNLLYAYTQVQGDSHVERVRAAGEYARRLAGKRLDPETIRTILETHGMPLPQRDAIILLAKEGVDIEHFRNEWRNLLFLNHPHLVQVYGGGIWQGHPYCVMERFADPLAPNLACAKLGLPDKLAIAIAAGEGVAHLHEKGLVHWDLRPENILILPAEGGGYTAKVTALGLTHGIDELLGKASAGEVLESLCCMAPEMVRGQGAGAQSDIYSLGACLYLLMTGHLPHDRKKRLFEIFESLRTGEAPTSARDLAPDLPEGVANMLDRAMAADPALRYGSMQEMLADLRALHADPEAPIVPLFKSDVKASATPPAPSDPVSPAPAVAPLAGASAVDPASAVESAVPSTEGLAFGASDALTETVDASWATPASNSPHPRERQEEREGASVPSPVDAAGNGAMTSPLMPDPSHLEVREPLAPPLPDTESPMPRIADTHAPRPRGHIGARLVRTLLVLVILGGIGYAIHQSRTNRIPETLGGSTRLTKSVSQTPDTASEADAFDTPSPDAPPPPKTTTATTDTEHKDEPAAVPPASTPTDSTVSDETDSPPDAQPETGAHATDPAPTDPQYDPDYVRLMQLANNAMRDQDFDAAMDHAADALQYELTSEATGIMEAARTRKHFRDTRDQAVERGRTLLEEGKWTDAEEAVQRVLAIEHYMQDEEAIAIQQAAREGQYDAVMERADRLLIEEDFDAAEMAYMEAMMIEGFATDPRAVEGQRKAFQAKMDATEAARAEDRQRRQLEMKYTLSMEEAQRLMEERKWMQAVQVLDTALSLEGYKNDAAALEARDKAARMTQEDPTHLKRQFEQFMVRGQAFLDAGEQEEAVEAFQRAMQIQGFETNPEVLAKLEEAQAAPPPAKPDPQSAEGTAAPDPAFLHMYGQAAQLAGEGKLVEAKAVIDQIRAMPGYADHPQVLEALRQIESAQQAQQTRPAPAPQRNLQGELDAVGGDPLRQIQIYDEALRERPGDRALQVRRIYALLDAGRFEDARGDAEALARQHAKDAWVHAILGTVYRQDGLYRSAAEAFEQAVAADSPSEAVAMAQFGLGELYFSSGRAGDFRTGITQDNEKAVAHLEKAAEAGNPAAMNNLGVAYAIGRGTRRDREAAAAWFAKAAEAGDPSGQFNYALILEQGSGVDRDEEAAVSWYEKAVAQGEPRAAARLADMVRRGRGVERDEERVQRLQTQAGEESARDRSPLLAMQSRALPALPVMQAEARARTPMRVQIPDIAGAEMPEPDTSTLQGIRPGAEAAMRFQSIMEEGQRLLMDGDADQARQVFALAMRVPGYEGNMMAKTNLQAAEQILAAQRRAAPPPSLQPGTTGTEEDETAAVSPQDTQYKSMMEEGRRLIIEQKWDAAVDVYEQVLRIPGYDFDVDAQNALRMAREARDVEEAARRPGYTLTPEERTTREYLAFMRKGHEQLAQKQWVVAKTIFGYALELAGYETDPNALAGQRAAEEGLRSEVVARQTPVQFEEDMRDTATYTAMMQEAIRQYQQGRYDGAEQLFTMVIELDGYEGDEAATRGLLMAQQMKGSKMPPDPSVTLEWLQAGGEEQTPPSVPPQEQTPPIEDGAQPPPDARLPAPPDPARELARLPLPTDSAPLPAGRDLVPTPPAHVEIPDIPQPPTASPPPDVVGESASASPSVEERARGVYQDLMVEASRLLSRGAYEEAESAYRRALAQPGYEDDPMARIGVETVIRERARMAASPTPDPAMDEALFDLPARPDDETEAGVVRIHESETDTLIRELPAAEDEKTLPDGMRDVLDEIFDNEPSPMGMPPATPPSTASPGERMPPRPDPFVPEADISMDDFDLPARAEASTTVSPDAPLLPDPESVARSLPEAPAPLDGIVPPIPDAVPVPPTDFASLVPAPPVPVPPTPAAVPPGFSDASGENGSTPIRLDNIVPPLPEGSPTRSAPAESATTPAGVDLRDVDPFRDLLADAELVPQPETAPTTEARTPLPEGDLRHAVPVLPEGVGEVPDRPEAFDAPPMPVQPGGGVDPAATYAARMERGHRAMAARAWDKAEEAFAEALRVPGYETDAPARAGREQARDHARVQAQRPTPRQLMEEGNRLENAGQFEEAIVAYTTALEMEPGNAALLISRADASVRAGQFRRAIADYEGVLALDLAPATRVYAYNHLANAFYFSEIDFQRAVAYYRKAADAGDPAAMNSLGVCYGFGRGVEQNARTSLDWYRRAAEQGYGLAMVNLGLAYQLGRDVEVDYARARLWYERAAEAGVPRAYVRLAILYEQGLGVEVDAERAAEFRRRARALGYQADG